MTMFETFLSLPILIQVLMIAAPLVILKVLIDAVPDEDAFDK